MKDSFFIGLLQNIGILMAFAMLYENIWLKHEDSGSLPAKILTGIILGGIGVVLISTPWTLEPGIVFDTRSIMLSLSGLFFGPLPTVLAMIITFVYRIVVGGSGLAMGLLVIVASGGTGMLWRALRPGWRSGNLYAELFAMGLTVHLIMLGSTPLLPGHHTIFTLKIITLPLLLIYVPGTVLLGLLLLRQSNNYQNRMAQGKLLETERRLNEILKSGNIVSLILDPSGRIIFCNNYLLEISGYTMDEILHGNWFDYFIPAPSREIIHQLFTGSITGKNFIERFENEIISRRGKIYFISWYNTLLYDEKDKITGVACIGVDITERKILEFQLREKNEKIEAQNKVYRKLNEELQVAKEKAEEGDKLKLAFLANLSHEIRSPMNAILGFTELLKQEDLDSQKRETYVSIIHNRGNYLLSIISDIVEMSKIETGQISPRFSEVNVDQLLEDIYAAISITIPTDKPVKLIFRNHKPVANFIISTDVTKLNQILTNLISNAIKFTLEGSVTFGYEITGIDYFRFFVEDTGIGIDAKYHQVIFERFRQLDHNRQPSMGGSGLGLAISRAYADMLGGTLNVSSEVGAGSRFTLTLPINRR